MLAGVPGPRTSGEGCCWGAAQPRAPLRASPPWSRQPPAQSFKGMEPLRHTGGPELDGSAGCPRAASGAQTSPSQGGGRTLGPRIQWKHPDKWGKEDPRAHPQGRGLTIVKLQDLVVDRRSHANGLAREIGVEVEAFSQRHPGGWLTVAREQGEDVVLTTVPGTRSVPQPLV